MTGRAAATAVAVLGLGRMGAPIASRLARAGFAVTGYDAGASSAAWDEPGVQRAESPAAAVHDARFVVTVLPGTAELRALMLGETGDALLDRIPRGAVWIDCTSTAPDVAAEVRTAATRRELALLDCALGGDPEQAAEGRLTVYVGGADDVVDRSRAVLAAFAAPDAVFHVGDAGAGTLAKLVVNLVWFGQATLAAEALLLVRAAGLDPARLADLLPATPAASRFGADYVPRLLRGDYVTTFGLDRVVEELDALDRLATDTGTPHPMTAALARTHREALARFGAVDGELLGVAHLEELAGGSLRDEQDPPVRG